jgi:hypothetical protein
MVLGIDPVYNYFEDERVKFLNEFHDIHLIKYYSFLPKKWKLLIVFFCKIEGIFTKFHTISARLKAKIFSLSVKISYKINVVNVLGDFSPDVLITDQNRGNEVQRLVKYTRKNGCISFALPHSASNFTNQLRILNWKKFSDTLSLGCVDKLFDCVIFPNKYDPNYNITPEKKVILGSARFSKLWVLEKERLFKSKKYFFPKDKDNTKVLFLFPKRQNNIFWDELIRSIEIIESYDFSVVFKLPVRGTHSLPKRFLNSPKIDIPNDSTGVLVEWADVVFYIDTTVIFEALIKDKTVVHLKHLHINSTSSDDMPGICRSHTRDDLVKLLDSFEEDSEFRPYDRQDTLKILEEVVFPFGREEPIDDYENYINNFCLEKKDETSGI